MSTHVYTWEDAAPEGSWGGGGWLIAMWQNRRRSERIYSNRSAPAFSAGRGRFAKTAKDNANAWKHDGVKRTHIKQRKWRKGGVFVCYTYSCEVFCRGLMFLSGFRGRCLFWCLPWLIPMIHPCYSFQSYTPCVRGFCFFSLRKKQDLYFYCYSFKFKIFYMIQSFYYYYYYYYFHCRITVVTSGNDQSAPPNAAAS